MVNLLEEWRPVVGYEGLYEVSDQGNVFTLHGRWGETHLLKYNDQPSGYKFVRLYKNKIGKQFLIQYLVLNAFVGKRPIGYECCHNNGIRDDNRLKNLRWDTRKGNFADKKKHGTEQIGERNPFAKHTESDVKKVLRLHATGLISGRGIARVCGFSSTFVHKIINRESWRHVKHGN